MNRKEETQKAIREADFAIVCISSKSNRAELKDYTLLIPNRKKTIILCLDNIDELFPFENEMEQRIDWKRDKAKRKLLDAIQYRQRINLIIPLPNLELDVKPLEMVLIPAGDFMMGSPDNEKDKYNNERPQHKVIISNPFYLGKYEVTPAQWQVVMGNNPAKDYGVGNDYPVYNVSWNDCQEFIKKLNQLGQGTFRLPTEAEWEYACRAGTTTRFFWGNDLNYTEIKDYAWYDGNNNPRGTKEVG
ncbi:MAG: formylglycine-generating enzyme family protein, partial [Candidatus Omnitrophota bacterium]